MAAKEARVNADAESRHERVQVAQFVIDDERRLAVAIAMPVVDRMSCQRGRVEVPKVVHGVDL